MLMRLCTFILTVALSNASLAAQAGGLTQPGAQPVGQNPPQNAGRGNTGNNNQNKGQNNNNQNNAQNNNSGSNGDAPDPATLLNSPDAREAAVFRCAAFTGNSKTIATQRLGAVLGEGGQATLAALQNCTLNQPMKVPANSTIGDVLTARINQPLKNGSNGDTQIAAALKLLLATIMDPDTKKPILSGEIPYVAIHLLDAQKLTVKPAAGQRPTTPGQDGQQQAPPNQQGPNGDDAQTLGAPADQQQLGGPNGQQGASGGRGGNGQTKDRNTGGRGANNTQGGNQNAGNRQNGSKGATQKPATPSSSNGPGERWVVAHRQPVTGKVELAEDARILGTTSLSVIFVIVNAQFPIGQDPTDPDQQPFSSISYNAIVKPKLPMNVQDLLGLLQVIGSFGQARAQLAQAAYLGWGTLAPVANPSDITVFGVMHAQDNDAANGTLNLDQQIIGHPRVLDNEGKHHWDVSVGVPVNKLSLLDYSQDTNQYLPKTINKQSVYGLFNLYLPAVDLKSTKLQYWPHVVAGLGLTGRPGESFFVGGAWGIPELQFFVGSGFADHNVLKPGASATTGTNFEQRYASRLTFGINIPVMAAVKKLQSKNGNNASGAGTGGANQKPAANQ